MTDIKPYFAKLAKINEEYFGKVEMFIITADYVSVTLFPDKKNYHLYPSDSQEELDSVIEEIRQYCMEKATKQPA